VLFAFLLHQKKNPFREQRKSITVCLRLRKNVTESFEMLKLSVTEGSKFGDSNDSEIIVGYTCRVQNTEHLQMFSTVTRPLGCLYQPEGVNME
jgi:hypothetical protein